MAKFKNPDTAALVRRRLSKNSDDVDALFVLAAIRVRGGKVAEGITILNQVLRIDPKYPGAWRFKATLHRMQGQDDAERSAQRKADEVEP
ncbi:MAG TPA: tetratricopeptide repeat protein [Thermoplasmata archaeon]|nr:tetratricopeptide repeat protein [Thermoplasmata archaeon]